MSSGNASQSRRHKCRATFVDMLSRASHQLQVISALVPGRAFPNRPPADAGLIGAQISKAGVPVPPALTCPGEHSISMLHEHLVSLPTPATTRLSIESDSTERFF